MLKIASWFFLLKNTVVLVCDFKLIYAIYKLILLTPYSISSLTNINRHNNYIIVDKVSSH